LIRAVREPSSTQDVIVDVIVDLDVDGDGDVDPRL